MRSVRGNIARYRPTLSPFVPCHNAQVEQPRISNPVFHVENCTLICLEMRIASPPCRAPRNFYCKIRRALIRSLSPVARKLHSGNAKRRGAAPANIIHTFILSFSSSALFDTQMTSIVLPCGIIKISEGECLNEAGAFNV